MNQLSISDLSFLQRISSDEENILGGRITPRVQLPRSSTAADTAVDTRQTAFATIDGDLETGFRINRRVRGSAASASASAVSLGGRATAAAAASAG